MLFACERLEPRRLFSTNVLSYHYNTANTGLDAVETTLTPANVGSSSFGEDFSLPVDGRVVAQPLYVSNLAIPGNGTHNVLFVATEADSVYAFDADTGVQLWKTSLVEPGETPGLVSADDVDGDIGGTYSGITGTPVIDSSSGTLYAVAKTQTVVNGVTTYIARLHALDITTGAEKFAGPTTITATVAGTSDGSTTVTFDPFTQLQRTGLALDNGVVYMGWCAGNGFSPWHGWVMGYNATSLKQVAVFCDTPNGPAENPPGRSGAAGGGIWMSGAAPVVDSNGNLYYAIGDGNFDPTLNAGFPANGDYGDSFVKLTPNTSTSANPNINGWGVSVTDYFAPSDQASLNNQDLDLGSGGLLMLSNPQWTTPNELIGSDKSGNIYVINMSNMGKYQATDQAVQELSGALNDPGATVVEEDGSYGTPALFNNVVYFHGANDVMKAFTLSNGMLQTPPAESNAVYQFPGATPVISANGTSNAIVWETQYSSTANGSLNAYSPTNLSTPLFSASLNDTALKFTAPIVADGHVYVGGGSSVVVFGLTTPAPAGSALLNAGGPATGSYAADADFSGGSTYSTTSSINTSADTTGAPAAVYQTERWGNFTYTVPNLVAGNNYSVLLHFAEIYWNSAGQRLFNVSINGQQVLTSFDIFAAAGGADKAIVESFNATADTNGHITITFTSVKDNAKIDAIDVVPTTVTPVAPAITTNPLTQTLTVGQDAKFTAAASGTPAPTVQWMVEASGATSFSNVSGATSTTLDLGAATLAESGNKYEAVFSNGVGSPATTTAATLTVNPAPITSTLLNAGGPAIGSYAADADFSGGSTYSTTSSINTSADTTGAPAAVYQTERWGNFTYTVPNLVAGNNYSVLLHFAEIYWNSAGQRLFNVSINGQQVLTSFDIFAAAGGADKAIVESFNATADTNGHITITFTSVKDNAKIDAIDVVPTTVTPVAPAITTNPLTQTLTVGQDAKFIAAASGTPAPTVQWMVEASGATSFSNVSGATSTTLDLGAATLAESGNKYEAVFSNGVGSPATTTAATLTVNPAPITSTLLNAGGPAIGSYTADADFSGGSTYSTTSSINTSADTTGAPASVYQTERWGNFTYTVPNLVAGNNYSVLLHFAEIYWNSAGQRLFNVSINGQQVLTSFDIFAAAGGADKAIMESFNATADTNGHITITFTSVKDNAKVSAIDVVPA